MRPVVVAAAIGVTGAAGWIVMALAGAAVMPSYLAAWLFWMAAPMGALPLVMTIEAFGVPETPFRRVLSRMLLLLPVGAVLALPVLLRTAVLFRRGGVADGLPEAWMAPGFFIARAVVTLAVLSVFALVFSRPAVRPRRALAVAGLMLHVCLVSVAAIDWVLSLQPGLNSSAIGFLTVVSQLGIAACLAAFLTAVRTRDGAMPGRVGALLTVLVAGWAFLHFLQFLVVWSANLPGEVVWYQARLPGGGTAAIWFAVVAVVAGLALLPTALAEIPAVLATVAATLLTMHLVGMLWMVTPAFRGQFSVTLADALAVLGMGGLLVAMLLAVLPREARHARA